MSVDLCCVDPKDVEQVWPYAGGMIRAAVEATNLVDFEDIENDVFEGRQLLWLAVSDHIEAAATTYITGKRCTLSACSGHSRDRWLPLFKHIEKYAKDAGCTAMRVCGRPGWERVLDGYRKEFVILEKAL